MLAARAKWGIQREQELIASDQFKHWRAQSVSLQSAVAAHNCILADDLSPFCRERGRPSLLRRGVASSLSAHRQKFRAAAASAAGTYAISGARSFCSQVATRSLSTHSLALSSVVTLFIPEATTTVSDSITPHASSIGSCGGSFLPSTAVILFYSALSAQHCLYVPWNALRCIQLSAKNSREVAENVPFQQ